MSLFLFLRKQRAERITSAGAQLLQLVDSFNGVLAMHFGDEVGKLHATRIYDRASKLFLVCAFARIVREGALQCIGIRQVFPQAEYDWQCALSQSQVRLALRGFFRSCFWLLAIF